MEEGSTANQRTRVLVLVVSTACVFLTSFSLTAYSVFVPALLKEFPWTRAEVVLPYALAMAVWGITQPIAGALADARGTRPAILFGISLMAVGFAIMGLSQDLWQIAIGFGVLGGAAISASGTLMFSLLISKWFTGASRASAVGFVQAAVPACPIVMAPLIFFGITTFGWRFAALGLAALLLVVALPLAFLGVRDPKTAVSSVDAGSSQSKWQEVVAVARFAALRNLFIARLVCGLSAALLLAHMAAAALEFGLSAADGAYALSIYGASGALGSFLGGFAADRWGRVPTVVAAFAVRGLGTLLLALPGLDRTLFFLAVALATGPITATFGINNVQVFELAGAKRAGFLLGISVVLHQAAGALSPVLAGMVFDWTGTYRWTFLGLGLVTLLATIPAAGTGPRRSTPQPAAAGLAAGAR